MKKLLIILLFLLSFNCTKGATITAVSDGSWTNAAIWSIGRLPQSGDNIIIPTGRTVTTPGFTDIDLTGPEVTTMEIQGRLTTGLLGSISINDTDGDLIQVGENGTVDGFGGFWFLPSFDLIAPFFEPGGEINGPVTLQNGVLPIELAFFHVQLAERGVAIEWKTASEENNDYFEVLRSHNGLNYEIIAKIDGAGNSNELLEYEFLDSRPLLGLSYYRLKQTDFDGKSEVFDAQSIYRHAEEDLVFSPNPVNLGESLNVYTKVTDGTNSSLEILSTSGKTVLVKEFSTNNTSLQIPIELKSGLYLLKVRSEKTLHIKRLLIKQ